MEDRLRPVNAVLGLLTPGDINTAALHEAGFRLAGLEVPLVGPNGGRVLVDLILFHSETLHFVLCEAKSGANVDESQARRYADVDTSTLVQATGTTVARRGELSFEVLYVCLAEHLDRIRLGLSNAEISFSILSVGDEALVLEDPGNASEALRRAWTDGAIPLAGTPPRLIEFDDQTPATQLHDYVKAQLVAALSNRTGEITIRTLTELTARHYALYGTGAQQRLIANVRSAVRTIAEDEPDTFAYEPRTGARAEDLVRLLKSPEERDPRGRTQAYQALRGRGPRRGRPAVSEHQVDLLDLLADAGEADNDRRDSEDDTGEEDER